MSQIEFVDLKGQYALSKKTIDARIQRVLDHGQYIMGPEVAELERRLSDFVGVGHCVGVSDGTTALLIAMMALDIGPGDEVITTPFTFIATGEMISLLGATPVFVDIDPLSYNIDPALIEAAITSRTRAIMPVSLFGQCADLDAINTIAAHHGLPVIEDAAQSFGATYKGKRSGGLTTIACTSFFPSKPLGCYGDGGACFTNDDRLAARMREIRVHGQSKRYHHTVLGLNGRLDTIQAAILLAKLESFQEELCRRAEVADRYAKLLSASGMTGAWVAPGNTSVYAQYTVKLAHRDSVAEALKAHGIPTAVHYPIPLHRQPVYADLATRSPLPRSESAAQSVLSLPMHPLLEESAQAFIVGRLMEAQQRVSTAGATLPC